MIQIYFAVTPPVSWEEWRAALGNYELEGFGKSWVILGPNWKPARYAEMHKVRSERMATWSPLVSLAGVVYPPWFIPISPSAGLAQSPLRQ